MRNNSFYIALAAAVLILITIQPVHTADLIGHSEEQVIEVYDEEDNYIFSIAMGIAKGDRYLSQDNIEYRIKSVEGEKAIAEKIGEVDLLADIDLAAETIPPLATEEKKLIGIYHTHNDESYHPGSTSKEGKGDIHKIGNKLAGALEKKGVEVFHSENLHLPHDGAAYARSRATALSIARKNPDIILDLHRDAIPDEKEYETTVGNKKVAQIRLVIGRQNPNQKVNEQFARRLKAVSDRITPGLVRDIFYGKGEYNQSIFPRLMLMEFGTYGNSEDQVEKSAVMLADSLAYMLYGGKGDKPIGSEGEERAALGNVFWIIVISVGGLLGYLYYQEGSWTGVKERIINYFRRELTDSGEGE